MTVWVLICLYEKRALLAALKLMVIGVVGYIGIKIADALIELNVWLLPLLLGVGLVGWALINEMRQGRKRVPVEEELQPETHE
ncbi:MAG: hypothetical protein U0670_17760 [Anaerolineae bacterium]